MGTENRYIDFQVVNQIESLEEKKIIIYGAGNYGRKAAAMLRDLGILGFRFCDRDRSKQGTKILGQTVFPPEEIKDEENCLILIAAQNQEVQREMEQSAASMEKVAFLSFFALELAWKYFVKDYSTFASKTERLSLWYKNLASRGRIIQDACQCPIVVFQSGKVGSTTITNSLHNAYIENAHLHHFFFKRDIPGELILGEDQEEFRRRSSPFHWWVPEYVNAVKREMRHKRIITLVREPIAGDLSLVFQWIGIGISDRFFAERIRAGRTFLQSVSDLMIKMQNRSFDWFDEELKELYGVDVFTYPFDPKKGYGIISEDNVEILLLKTEKLSEMAEVIRDFTGCRQLELKNSNIGGEKGYAHIYKEVKERLRLSEDYVENYYKNNPRMNHFYSAEEQKTFLDQWLRHV